MEYKKIGDLTNVITGGTPPTAKPEYWDNGDIPWLQSGCCQDCDVDFAEKYITCFDWSDCRKNRIFEF